MGRPVACRAAIALAQSGLRLEILRWASQAQAPTPVRWHKWNCLHECEILYSHAPFVKCAIVQVWAHEAPSINESVVKQADAASPRPGLWRREFENMFTTCSRA